MNELTPLTSKSGESEWPYKKKTLIAEKGNLCFGCYLFKHRKNCSTDAFKKIGLPDCTKDFSESVIYIEKPATK